MQPGNEETPNSNGSCASGPNPQPCACCTALAQLRMPWMDVAMQHAPHYAYAQYGRAPLPEQFDEEDEIEIEAEPASNTLFFKLPGFGKKENKAAKKTNRSRQVKAAALHRAPSRATNAGAVPSAGSASPNNESSSRSGQDDELDPSLSAEPRAGSSDDIGEAETDPLDATLDTTAAPKKARFKINFGIQGVAVSIFGIFLPAFILLSTILSTPSRITLVSLHHPVETLVEFLLVLAIPLVNFLVWSAICKSRAHLSRPLVMALGAIIGSALVISGISFACLFSDRENLTEAIGSDFAMGFTWLGMISFLSAAVSAYLANRLRKSWELDSTRLKVTIQAVTGMILAFIAFAGAEYRPWCIRMAQFNAVAKDDSTRRDGLRWLRQLNPEREMRMECHDSRAAGLPGIFFPIKPRLQQQLYFTLTGTPYSFRDMNAQDLTSMPDDYLSRHVVGDKIPQLDLTRSTLNGVLHADTLSSTLNWTFVVKNGSSRPQEMRAELGLPAGAAITGLTVWHKGEPEDADFVASGNKLEGITTTAGGDTPAMVTDMGHGRVLLHCFPVPKEEELKVRVSMVLPLRSENAGEASLITPQLIASNFDLEGEHLLRLRSQTSLSSNVLGLEKGKKNPAGESIVSGTLTTEQLETSPLLVSAKRNEITHPFAVLDKLAIKLRREDEREQEIKRIRMERLKEKQRKEAEKAEKDELGQVVVMIDGSKAVPTQIQDLRKILAQHKHEIKQAKAPKIVTIKPEYAIEDVSRVAAPAPKHLVVVIDGSATMLKFSKDIKTAFSNLPASIPTSVIIASQEDQTVAKVKELKEILPNLDKIQFAGGQDNLKAVVSGAELAGETKDSAVLWIHGPQPVLNQENYIMSPYEAQPTFYELPVVAGTDTFEFFRNHTEIGPFTQVPRNGGTIASDLSDFFARWNPNKNSYVATISESQKQPDDAIEPSKEEGKELIMLRAMQECNKLINERHFHRAARIAARYGFVSAVSSALLGQNPNQGKDLDSNIATAATPNNGEANNGTENTESTNSAENADASSASSSAAPLLQGATNGTIGPQGSDATVIEGVNTAGTVRVNNLANLEALLNIIANLGEIGALLAGLGLAVHGFMNKAVMKLGDDIELGAGGRIVIGIVLIVFGLALPGVINFFVASARDANLFS